MNRMGLLIAIVCVLGFTEEGLSDETPLQGKRLFFSAQERQQRDRVPGPRVQAPKTEPIAAFVPELRYQGYLCKHGRGREFWSVSTPKRMVPFSRQSRNDSAACPTSVTAMYGRAARFQYSQGWKQHASTIEIIRRE
jgi:hypothetical protein